MVTSGRRRFVLLAAMAAIAVALVAAAAWWQQTQRRLRGAALFHGQRQVVARLAGHTEALPAIAARCSNCHETLDKAPSSTSAPNGNSTAHPYGGAIGGEMLTVLRPRRGGPPSAYDEPALCELLRSGIDPAKIIVSSVMPRYELASADCADLWTFLRHESV